MRSRSRVGSSFARERGAVVVYVAFFLGVLLAAGTLAIDIGRLYNAQRELQRAANIAALDAAAVSGGCYGALDDSPLSVAQDEAADSLARNGLPPSYLSGSNAVRLGKMVSEGGVRRFEPLSAGEDEDARTAVQVTLTRPTPQRILPLSQGPNMTATVAADSRPQATFGVGSGLAGLSQGVLNSLLGGLLGGSINLTVAQYQGLLNANVRLGDLALAAGAASVDDFLTSSSTLPAAFDNILNALGDGESGTVRTTLTALAAGASSARNVTPGDVLLAPVGLEGSGENALINVGQLVTALAMSANGSHAIDLPLSTALGTAHITIIEPPQLAIARAGDTQTYAQTSQAQIDIDIGIPTTTINVAGLVQASFSLTLPLKIRAAKALAHLQEVQCARSGQPQHVVTLGVQTSALDLGIGTFTSPIGGATPAITPVNVGTLSAKLVFIPVPVATISAGAYAGLGSDTDTGVDFESPFPSTIQSVSTDVGDAVNGLVTDLVASLGQPNGLKVTALGGIGLPVGNAVAPILNVLAPILGTLGSALEPILALLGVTVGNADVQVASLVPVHTNAADPSDPEALSLQAFLFSH